MLTREQIARRAAREIRDGDTVNLGIGLPTLVANYVPAGIEVVFHVHDEAVHGGLDPGVGDRRGVPGLECRVERALAERREVRHGGATR